MKNIVIWGYCFEGLFASELIYADEQYRFWGFADNNVSLHNCFSYGQPIRTLKMLLELRDKISDLSVLIASPDYIDIIRLCETNNIDIEGIFLNRKVLKYSNLARFDRLDFSSKIVLFAGDINDKVNLNKDEVYGLSINRWDEKHIYHDITKNYPLPDNSIDSYISENVFEFIDEHLYTNTLNEIYRILKVGGHLRISMPDYNSPFMKRRALTDKYGNVVFDAREDANMSYSKSGIKGGSLFFSTYENFKPVLEKTKFNKFDWLRYFKKDGTQIYRTIDMEKGYLWRNDRNLNLEDYNIVVDCIK